MSYETAEIVTDLASLADLAPQWRQLAVARGNAFVTPEWCFAWFERYGDHYQPLISVVRGASGKVLGVMPLALSTASRPRSLRFAGANLGDSFHPASGAVDEQVTAAATAVALASSGTRWSTILLDNVPADSPWVEALLAALPRRPHRSTFKSASLPMIALGGMNWEEFQSQRKRSVRRERARCLRRLESEHEVRFRSTRSEVELDRDIDTLFNLHDLRREQLGGSSLSSERARSFHRTFAKRALAQGWLRLSFLEIDGEAAAAAYDWQIGSRYACYQSGFDPTWSSYGVGALLEDYAIETAIAAGAEEFDMLLGDEAYKLRQATAVRRVETVAAVKAWHPARLALSAETRLRQLTQVIPAPVRQRSSGLGRHLPSARNR